MARAMEIEPTTLSVGGEFGLQAFELDKVLWQQHAATVRRPLPQPPVVAIGYVRCQLPGTWWMAGKNISRQLAGRALMLPTSFMNSAYFMRFSGDVV